MFTNDQHRECWVVQESHLKMNESHWSWKWAQERFLSGSELAAHRFHKNVEKGSGEVSFLVGTYHPRSRSTKIRVQITKVTADSVSSQTRWAKFAVRFLPKIFPPRSEAQSFYRSKKKTMKIIFVAKKLNIEKKIGNEPEKFDDTFKKNRASLQVFRLKLKPMTRWSRLGPKHQKLSLLTLNAFRKKIRTCYQKIKSRKIKIWSVQKMSKYESLFDLEKWSSQEKHKKIITESDKWSPKHFYTKKHKVK